MKKVALALLAFLALNTIAVDTIALRVDKHFTETRDDICASRHGNPNGFTMIVLGGPGFKHVTRLYGCDANGKTYRMWVER